MTRIVVLCKKFYYNNNFQEYNMDFEVDAKILSDDSTTELYCEKINFETYPNSYNQAFAERQFMEQIMLDPIENVYEKFPTTMRTNQSLFRNGFLIYRY